MSKYPRKDRRSRTGSNLYGQPLLVYQREGLTREALLHQRLALEQQRQSRELFSSADLRQIAEIANQVESEWWEASVEAGGDSARLDALKLSSRRKLERLLTEEFPAYTQWRAMRQTHRREHGELTAASLAAAPIVRGDLAWGDHSSSVAAGQEFDEPFTVFEVNLVDRANQIVHDASFVNPDIGHMANNIVFDRADDVFFTEGLWGLLLSGHAASQVSCGAVFTAPSPGRLQVSAVLQNLYNKVTLSVHDLFGVSSADVNVVLRLFIAVIRGTRVIYLPTHLRHASLFSDGEDSNLLVAALDDSVPYTVSVVTEEILNANESVTVLAGSEVEIATLLDDMRCNMNAVLWWELKKLIIGVTE